MDLIFVSIIGGILLLAVLISTIQNSFEITEDDRRNKFLVYSASTLIITGACGFFGTLFLGMGLFNFIPDDLEWPAGYASNVVRLSNGNIVVPLDVAKRIQIYTKDLEFKNGWGFNAKGGKFKIRAIDDNRIEVFLGKTGKSLEYSIEGKLLSVKQIEEKYDDYFYESGENLRIPTSPILYVFVHPFIAFSMLALGTVLLGKPKRFNPFIYTRSQYKRGKSLFY